MTTVLTLCLALLTTQAVSQPDLVQSIERQQGGRHWIDQPTDPPKTPEESAGCFQIEPGFKIELVACEPIVRDPVAIDFDHKGRMFVVEYGDYPVGPKDPNEPPLSQVVLLEDENDDGKIARMRNALETSRRTDANAQTFFNRVQTVTEFERNGSR